MATVTIIVTDSPEGPRVHLFMEPPPANPQDSTPAQSIAAHMLSAIQVEPESRIELPFAN